MIQKIVQSGDPLLRLTCKPVTQIDKKIKAIIKDLKDTLSVQIDPEGVGLAAPQIGKNLRIFVVGYKNLKRVVINPEIIKIEPRLSVSKDDIKKQSKKPEILEGCLSLPYYYGPLKREGLVKIKYLNEDGCEVVEEFKGFNAQIILHEIDHLNGILFIDHLLEQNKKLFKLSETDEWEEVEI
ncbi:peptide deformylase [Candidatus Woesebacteria bacterium RIFOXYC1_FULL_31_51]|uniref:Peptide deformylase n=1 Tax=Candidatus Woesebacteria bacterium GW2011_GWC2_31_9 TaxID=1618586 RepID=A0A0G0BMK5_9BACT|nr:MAG: peptide deformylase, peptide deformylase [Candidatus Woesebacteria bacterium GW2011_GWF1_31_35]KKP22821.1 MAG: Peptide deformylase [Candidatus Woesebacteria bacterium GW2011_GWC1_30_29]KKP26691.1 MAG: Peptide deformylase [Candidatus Woesebacteria bacterium GW2011_GWD1_31_12]KKP28069.1 MAG: Peptide deformylase [Candidatus Woesebacteria bacterium GW2011_GWB1_31_29]KKP32262.1 MAG: Peptide deformylase [Candidatus Woesebacteria bacterium GW2011_GWC2_31_9]KKP33626.1 MAG: Peptide deformylase 